MDVKNSAERIRPLADRMRPRSFDEMVGQPHLVGENGALRRLSESGFLPNMIFFGPPGTGKTTAANIIAESSGKTLCRLNATTASISDIRDVTQQTSNLFGVGGILLYLDEIQYFNKKQQQSLLEFLEDGRITLIASTTENPYFYVYGAMISRCSVFEFRPVSDADMIPALKRGLRRLNEEYGDSKEADEGFFSALAALGAGDVRRALGALENAFHVERSAVLTPETLRALAAESATAVFDRDGDAHYDTLSAFQKSIRGSDPDAAIFYLAKLLEGGDLLSACRRLLVIASEDIGQAYPLAAAVTQSCVAAARELGLPEAKIPLSNATILLATAPKSNSANEAYGRAAADLLAGKGKQVPEHLRDSHYGGAESLGHGTGYRYPHSYPGHWVEQQYLPDDLAGSVYYEYGENRTEQAAKQYAESVRGTPRAKKEND